MRNIEIFYHLYIVPDARAVMWPWFLDQQLGLIDSSKLRTVANTNICITMPRYWNAIFGIPFESTEDIACTFEDKVREYLSLRYPWVTVTDIRDVGLENISEAHTLGYARQLALTSSKDFDLLYLNNKGAVSGFKPEVYEWRKLLDHYMISKWPSCLKHLADCDVVGVQDKKTGTLVTSGNFWWSKSEYIKTLPDPLDNHLWAPDGMHRGQAGFRYSCELWIMQNNPRYWPILSTGVDHYVQFHKYLLNNDRCLIDMA